MSRDNRAAPFRRTRSHGNPNRIFAESTYHIVRFFDGAAGVGTPNLADDDTLVALALLAPESEPAQKDLMVKSVEHFLLLKEDGG